MQPSESFSNTWTDNRVLSQKTIIAILSLIMLVITIIVTIIISTSSPNNQSIIAPISSATEPIIRQLDYTATGQKLQKFIASKYNLSPEELSNLKAVIREDTIEYDINSNHIVSNVRFFIDVIQPRLTYIVDNQIDDEKEIILSCPPNELAQDPSIFCVGSDNKTTIDANLSQYLPHQGTTRNGIKYYLRKEADIIADPKLIAYASICNNETNLKEVQSDIDFWLIQHNISNPEIIPITINDSGCNQ